MTRTLIGLDYAGVPCVKITKGDFDPVTTPDSQVGAFFYNSKWSADVKVTYTWIIPYQAGSIYYPPGAGSSNYSFHTHSLSGSDYVQHKFFRRHHFPNLPYAFPLFDVKSRRISNGRFIGEMVRKSSMTGYQQRGTKWTSSAGSEMGWLENYHNDTLPSAGTMTGIYTQSIYQLVSSTEYFMKAVSVWRLPGDNTAIIDGQPKAPVPGQQSIQISKDGVRAAKPGYDVNVATPTQIAFGTDNNPAKIIAADDIYLPVGVTDYEIGIGIPYGTVADVHFYDGGTISFPASPSSSPYGAEYWFEGSKMRFNNTDRGCRARFIVIAFDETPATAGDNEVLRQFDWGGQNIVQFLRPGASGNPSFADIALDSRWPCLQILAEGYLPVSGDGHQTYQVNFNGDGVFPMVKYMTVHGGGGDSLSAWSKRVRAPFVSMIGLDRIPAPTPQVAGDCTYADLYANHAVFHTYRGLPVRSYYNSSSDYDSGRVSYEYDNSLQGLRYYILGIPRKD